MPYWDKNIRPLPDNSKLTDADSVRIGDKVYYGRKYTKWDTLSSISSIAAVIASSILLFPITVPIFAYKDTYRNTLKRMQELKYDRKLKFFTPRVIQKSTPLDENSLKVVLKDSFEGFEGKGKKALKRLGKLSTVAEEWGKIIKGHRTEFILHLLNLGKICFNDLAPINTKQLALPFIENHQMKTMHIKGDREKFNWSSAEIKRIVELCPDLENLTLENVVTDAAIKEVVKLKKLKQLTIIGHIRQQYSLKGLDALEVLRIDGRYTEELVRPGLKYETKVNTVRSMGRSFPSLDNLPSLSEIYVTGFDWLKGGPVSSSASSLRMIELDDCVFDQELDFSSLPNLIEITIKDSELDKGLKVKEGVRIQSEGSKIFSVEVVTEKN